MPTAIDQVVTSNHAQVNPSGEALPAPPSRQLAVVTCMDARLDPLAALGLSVGEAHVIRNAGGIVTDDVLRSLVISQRALGTREIAVLHHTKCGMQDFDDDAFRAELETETGAVPRWTGPGFSDPHERARESVNTLRECPWLLHTDGVRGFVWDVATSQIDEVEV